MKYYAGLDVSLDETAVCIVDEDGIVIREGKVASEPDDLHAWIAAAGVTLTRLGLEAGPLSPWLHAGLRAAGLPAICIETRRMKGATAAMAVKTDRNDARAIAHAMRTGWFTAVHVKTPGTQELRLLLSNQPGATRKKQIAIDNEVRGTLKAFGPQGRAVTVGRVRESTVIGTAGRETAATWPLVRPMLDGRARALRQPTRKSYTGWCSMFVRIRARCAGACFRCLGVGAIVVLTYVTGVDDPARFAHARDLGPHFGLTPRKYASGEIDRNGPITKAGDGAVRKALSPSSTQAC